MIRRLAEFRGVPVVTSLYLGVDGRQRPRPSDFARRLDSLERAARRHASALGPGVAEAVEADLERISEWLAQGVDRHTTRGIATFACARCDFFEVLELPVAVPDQVTLDEHPDVAQLCEALQRSEPVLVVLVDRHRSRFVRLAGSEVEEHEGAADAAARRVDTDVELGGWQRRYEEELRHHLRRVAAQVEHEVEVKPTRRVVLSGPSETVRALEALLPLPISGRLAGNATLPVTASHEQVARVAFELTAAARRREEDELVGKVRDRADQHHGAVAGLRATLDALGAGEAATLVVESGMHADGAKCLTCSQLTTGVDECPRCGGPLRTVEDVVEAAVTEAYANHVEVEFCHSPALQSLGGIGALVRV